MTQANKASAADQKAPAKIQGRVDAIEGRRLFGWVWDAVRPGERVLVRVLREGRMVASATADMARVDLRRNGIGDGSHAFEIELPEDVAASASSLEVVAVSPATGAETVLQVPTSSERAAEAAISGPLNKVLDRLELLIEAQRRSQIVQRESVQTMRDTAAKVEEIVTQEDGIGQALATVRKMQAEISERIAEAEVVNLRFDKTLADFDRRIEDLANSADRPMRRAVAILIAFGGISAVSAIATLIMILRHWSA
jgi:hypothetical protein